MTKLHLLLVHLIAELYFLSLNSFSKLHSFTFMHRYITKDVAVLVSMPLQEVADVRKVIFKRGRKLSANQHAPLNYVVVFSVTWVNGPFKAHRRRNLEPRSSSKTFQTWSQPTGHFGETAPLSKTRLVSIKVFLTLHFISKYGSNHSTKSPHPQIWSS